MCMRMCLCAPACVVLVCEARKHKADLRNFDTFITHSCISVAVEALGTSRAAHNHVAGSVVVLAAPQMQRTAAHNAWQE